MAAHGGRGRKTTTTLSSSATSDEGEVSACCSCSSKLGSRDKAMCCDFCYGWFCLKCAHLSKDLYDMLNAQKDVLECFMWFCPGCKRALPGMKNILTKTSNIERSQTVMEGDINDLKEQVRLINERSVNIVPTTEGFADTIESMVQEEVSEATQNNLILQGVVESVSGESIECKELDIAQVVSIIKDITEDEPDNFKPAISSIERIGPKSESKPRLLKTVFNDSDYRKKVLTDSKKLRSSDSQQLRSMYMYVVPDLTRREREANYHLRVELRQRRDQGENVQIRRGKVVTVQL